MRFLYRLPRFFEDLDFSLSQALSSYEHTRFTEEFNRNVDRTISIFQKEIDTDPPSGAQSESSIIRKYSLLNVQHYDKSSLFAGKLHALLSRDYTKGRDLYDTLWYLSDPGWPAPNINFLNTRVEFKRLVL